MYEYIQQPPVISYLLSNLSFETYLAILYLTQEALKNKKYR